MQKVKMISKEEILKSGHFVRVEIIVPLIKNIHEPVKPFSEYETKSVSDFMLYNMVKFLEYSIEYTKNMMITPYEVIDHDMNSRIVKDNIIKFPKEMIQDE